MSQPLLINVKSITHDIDMSEESPTCKDCGQPWYHTDKITFTSHCVYQKQTLCTRCGQVDQNFYATDQSSKCLCISHKFPVCKECASSLEAAETNKFLSTKTSFRCAICNQEVTLSSSETVKCTEA